MMTNTFVQSQQFSARRMAGGAFYSSMPTVFGEAPTNGLPFAEYDLIFDNNFVKKRSNRQPKRPIRTLFHEIVVDNVKAAA